MLCEVFVDPHCAAVLVGTHRFGDYDTNRVYRHAAPAHNHLLADDGLDPAVSRHRQLSNPPYTGNFAAMQVMKKIFQVFLEVFRALALGQIVGEFFEVTKPMISVPPIDVSCCLHRFSLDRTAQGPPPQAIQPLR